MSVRSVRRLRVRAGTEDEAQHAAVLLSDALATASLPLADDGRLVVVRHLPLGRISVGGSPASLALHIERVARELMAGAVTCDQPAAARANAVVFRNPADAVIAAARALASDAPADEWFWPRVIPGWSETPRVSRWSVLIDAAHHLPGSPVVAAAMVHEAVRSASGQRFVSSIAPADAAGWLRVAGWHEWSSGLPSAAPARVTPFRAAAIAQWHQRWRTTDDRLVWLVTMLTVHDHPACAGDANLAARIAASLPGNGRIIVGPARVSTAAPSGTDSPPHPDDPEEVHYTSPMHATPQAPHALSTDDAASPAMAEQTKQVHVSTPQTSSTTPLDGRPAVPAGSDADATESQPRPGVQPITPHLADAFTAFGGLMLVVPILERLGFAAFVAADPRLLDDDFPARLLWSIGRRVGMSIDDPLSVAFAGEPARMFRLRDVTTLPPAAQEILSTPQPRVPMHSAVDAWTAAVRRWSRRHARQGLTSLIRKPARVHMSSTHIDIDFRLSQADVRVRRVALDVDPGWVPWLGHVVQFRYLDRR